MAVGDAALGILERRPGRARGEDYVVLAGQSGAAAARGLWFHGRPAAGLRPWADLVVTDLSILPAVTAALGPGSAVMVAYGGDDTERALRRGVPPAATPVGRALLAAGCRWFKDWYFAEGGREGGTKLQGSVPLDDAHRSRAEQALRRELQAFTARPGVRRDDARAAREALALLAAGDGAR